MRQPIFNIYCFHYYYPRSGPQYRAFCAHCGDNDNCVCSKYTDFNQRLGVRELTSIAILGEIGISAASALVISVSVGICANISFAVVLPYLLKKARHTKARAVLALHHPNKKTVQSLNYFIITLTSVLILAQITIRPFSVDFSFNLADPVVLMTLSSLVITTITAKTLPK